MADFDWVKRAKDEFEEKMDEARDFLQEARNSLKNGDAVRALNHFMFATQALGHAEGLSDAIYMSGGRTKTMEERIESAERNVQRVEEQISRHCE